MLIKELISKLEYSQDTEQRICLITQIGESEIISQKIYKLLENLLISDADDKVRVVALNILKKKFYSKSIKAIKWCFKYDTSIELLLEIIENIDQFSEHFSDYELIEKILQLKPNSNKNAMETILEPNKIRTYSHDHLIATLKKILALNFIGAYFYQYEYQVQEGKVKALEFSKLIDDSLEQGTFRIINKVIKAFNSLETLSLKFSLLKDIPYSIGALKDLHFIDLSFNELESLSDHICKIETLDRLDLSYNRITKVSSLIHKLKSLKTLQLRGNRLHYLPLSFGKIHSLQNLDFYNNSFRTIPKSVYQLANLKLLNLGHNDLRQLEKGLVSLNSLHTLDLSSNSRLNKIPDFFGSFRSLNELRFCNNNLTELPQSFKNLKSLEILDLNSNRIKTIPSELASLKSLRKLDLSWNLINSIPEWIISLKALEELNLWGNLIECIPKSLLELPNLKYFSLNYNKYNKEIPKILNDLGVRGLQIPS